MEINYIRDYIKLQHPSVAKQVIWILFFFITISGSMISFVGPSVTWIKCVVLFLTAIIDLFSFYLLINFEKKQIIYVFYQALFCFNISLILLIGFYKLLYMVLHIQSIIPVVISVTLWLLILILGLFRHIQSVKRGDFSQKSKLGKGTSIIVAFSVLGTIIGQFLVDWISQKTIILIMAIILFIMSLAITFGVFNIYKFYLLKKFGSELKV